MKITTKFILLILIFTTQTGKTGGLFDNDFFKFVLALQSHGINLVVTEAKINEIKAEYTLQISEIYKENSENILQIKKDSLIARIKDFEIELKFYQDLINEVTTSIHYNGLILQELKEESDSFDKYFFSLRRLWNSSNKYNEEILLLIEFYENLNKSDNGITTTELFNQLNTSAENNSLKDINMLLENIISETNPETVLKLYDSAMILNNNLKKILDQLQLRTKIINANVINLKIIYEQLVKTGEQNEI